MSEWRDTGRTKLGRLLRENVEKCGYVPPSPPQIRWVDGGHICVGYDAYNGFKEQISYDNGLTWSDTGSILRGELIESQSSRYCNYVPPTPQTQYQYVDYSTECDGFKLYNKQKKQVSYDGGLTWTDVLPLETRRGTLISECSEECGCIPQDSTPVYRWIVDGYMCYGGYKYEKLRQQKCTPTDECLCNENDSIDSSCWTYTNVSPKRGKLLDKNFEECKNDCEKFNPTISYNNDCNLFNPEIVYNEQIDTCNLFNPEIVYNEQIDTCNLFKPNIIFKKKN